MNIKTLRTYQFAEPDINLTMNNETISWEIATWNGSCIAQLKRSLKLTPEQRFEALGDFVEVSNWFALSKKSLLT
ncbi:MAG: hypothetical protein OQL19_00885 [Gammaproteobacteria bacterium]|nr:hypothetical protein [Gammaproteobacteria bacterium]